VAGTPGTISTGAYQNAIKAIASDAAVFVKACPLLVPLAEEGWTSGAVPEQVASAYLADLLAEGIDALVLGCTHYPLLKETIAKIAGESVTLVDSAEATAEVVAEVLDGLGIRAESNGAPRRRFLVSDSPEQFARVGQRFLGRPIETVEWVDF
jgi:glutamate racemase